MEDNLYESDVWRIFRIMGEFVEGFETLEKTKNAVTVWGSARTKENDEWYIKAVETGKILKQPTGEHLRQEETQSDSI